MWVIGGFWMDGTGLLGLVGVMLLCDRWIGFGHDENEGRKGRRSWSLVGFVEARIKYQVRFLTTPVPLI